MYRCEEGHLPPAVWALNNKPNSHIGLDVTTRPKGREKLFYICT